MIAVRGFLAGMTVGYAGMVPVLWLLGAWPIGCVLAGTAGASWAAAHAPWRRAAELGARLVLRAELAAFNATGELRAAPWARRAARNPRPEPQMRARRE